MAEDYLIFHAESYWWPYLEDSTNQFLGKVGAHFRWCSRTENSGRTSDCVQRQSGLRARCAAEWSGAGCGRRCATPVALGNGTFAVDTEMVSPACVAEPQCLFAAFPIPQVLRMER